MKNIINLKEGKFKEMVHGKEKNKIDELVSHLKKIEIPECVEVRIQETYKKILESPEEKD